MNNDVAVKTLDIEKENVSTIVDSVDNGDRHTDHNVHRGADYSANRNVHHDAISHHADRRGADYSAAKDDAHRNADPGVRDVDRDVDHDVK